MLRNIKELRMLPNETLPRMTKRIKQYKPKQHLTKAEVQSLSSMLKYTLEDLEYRLRLETQIAMSYKLMVSNSDNYAEQGTARHFAKARKLTAERNRIAKIQHKLKKGLPE